MAKGWLACEICKNGGNGKDEEDIHEILTFGKYRFLEVPCLYIYPV